MKRSWLCLLCVCTSTASLFAQAQSSSGDLRGTIVDPGGAAIAQAKVTASDQERGTSRATVTDNAGEYRIPLLPAGTYQLRIEAVGFNTKVMEGVVIRVGDTV